MIRHQKLKYYLLIFFQITPVYLEAASNCTEWVAKVVSVQGKVETQRLGIVNWKAIQQGDVFCQGDKIRSEKNSRATLQLSNNSLISVDQNTNLNFSVPKVEAASSWLIELFKGSAFFRSRESQRLNINTPFINAVHEGTEFLVTVNSEQTEITVFDGQVAGTNQQGKIHIKKGFTGIAKKGEAPRVKALTIRPEDAVQWTLYYPPIIDYQHFTSAAFKPVINAYEQGNTYQALDVLEDIPTDQQDGDYLVLKSSLLLTVGRVEEALELIKQARSLKQNESSAIALQSIILVAKNRQDEALKLAQQAVTLNPQSAVSQIALSYAYQSNFKIEPALQATKEATRLSPDNALAWARLSELQLSTGERSDALESAKKAQALNPQLSRTHTILGFANLAGVDIDEAKTAFSQAIHLNSADPLARLGLGLAKIRKGDVEEGTNDLETAVSLDPDNAIMRSYLGKAYYELKKDGYAGTELAIAKEMDPNDPTPWFYDSIRKQTTNRPGEAFLDMQRAIKLNDNRAIYRSSLLLDKDRADRNTSLARIYSDISFNSASSLIANDSINQDPTNWSAHRFLSDSFANTPRHEIARTSELLQSQLLQPLMNNPIAPRLAFSDVNFINGNGLFSQGFNEFSSMFNGNDIKLLTSLSGGINDSLANETILSGLHNNIAFSLGQFHSTTDGFRDNSEVDNDFYNAYVQIQITPSLDIQAEYRRRETTQGDIQQRINLQSQTEQREINQDIGRFGAHYNISPNSDLIGSFIYSDLDETANIGVNTNQVLMDGYQWELQHIFDAKRYNLVTGGRCNNLDNDFNISTNTAQISFDQNTTNSDFNHCGFYFYTNLYWPSKQFVWTAGLSYDSYKNIKKGVALDPLLPPGLDGLPQNSPVNAEHSVNKINPKFGFQWQLTEIFKLRFAYFKTFKSLLIVDQTIEPTQVAGFNQLYDDFNATKSEFFGIGLNANFNKYLLLGAEVYKRNLNVPADTGSSFIFDNWKEKTYRSYLYWNITHKWSMAFEPSFEQFELNRFVSSFPNSVNTVFVPLSLSYFNESGFFAKAGVTFVHQEVESSLSSANLSASKSVDDFVITNASIGYRLPNRWGMINLEVNNLFDEQFSYQDKNFRTARKRIDNLSPKRSLTGNITLNF